jgi:hypothetical protein
MGHHQMPQEREDTATVDIKIRMKEPLRAEIEKSAKDKGISMNAEMINRLGFPAANGGRDSTRAD